MKLKSPDRVNWLILFFSSLDRIYRSVLVFFYSARERSGSWWVFVCVCVCFFRCSCCGCCLFDELITIANGGFPKLSILFPNCWFTICDLICIKYEGITNEEKGFPMKHWWHSHLKWIHGFHTPIIILTQWNDIYFIRFAIRFVSGITIIMLNAQHNFMFHKCKCKHEIECIFI